MYVNGWPLFSANLANLKLYHGENKSIFNEMMMRFALFQTNNLSWICIVLAHWNKSRRIDISSHIDTWSRFRVKQSSLFLINADGQRRRNTYQFHSLWFDPIGFRAHETSTLAFTPPMRYIFYVNPLIDIHCAYIYNIMIVVMHLSTFKLYGVPDDDIPEISHIQ